MRTLEFGSMFEFIRNGMSVKQDKSGDGLPISRIETIADATVNPDKVGFAGLKLEDCKSWLLQPGDILFSHINSVEHVGKCAVYRGFPEQLVHGMNLLCLRCDPKVAIPEFAKYLIRGPAFRSKLSNFINKAVNQASVSIGNLKTISVRVPSISEQRRIAAILDQADALRAKRREALTQLDSLTQSIFIEMFGDPSKDGRKWKKCRLDKVAQLQNGRAFKPTEWEEDGLPIIRIQNLNDASKPFNYSKQNFPEKYLVRNNEILFSWSGTPGTSFGCFRWKKGDGWLNQHIFKVTLDETAINGEFFIQHMNLMLNELIEKAHGGVGLQHVTKGMVDETLFILPPMAQQIDFAEIAHSISKMCLLHTESAKELDILFSALQHRAFAGEL